MAGCERRAERSLDETKMCLTNVAELIRKALETVNLEYFREKQRQELPAEKTPEKKPAASEPSPSSPATYVPIEPTDDMHDPLSRKMR